MRFRAASIAVLLLTCGVAKAESGDEVCFPIYREAGAVPLTSDCPFIATTASFGLGTRYCGSDPSYYQRYCSIVLKPPKCGENADVGHPIDSSTGNKHLTERDFIGTGLHPLLLERYYNSSPLANPNGSFGSVWRSNLDLQILNPRSSKVQAIRADGSIIYYTNVSGVWTADKDMMDVLTQQKNTAGATTGWTLRHAADDLVERYDAKGMLTSLTARNGQQLTITRSTSATPENIAPAAGYMISVRDQFARTLSFTWTYAGYIATVTDPESNVFSYQYDGDLLTSATYPDGASPLPSKQYVYNESAYNGGVTQPTVLTGIVDENGNRLAIYRYDAQGRAIGTEYAGSADKFDLTYATNTTTIVDPLRSSRVYSFQKVLGATRLTGISQPGGAGCAAASNLIVYDANANVKERTDFTGAKTVYTYDLTRNLETARTQAFGTTAARTISTAWHPTLRLPAKTAQPKLITSFTYDANGNLLTRTLQATTDATGAQGFAAVADGAARTWTYTYNAFGQMLTELGPRRDVVDRVSYSYDAVSGNLLTLTTQLGLVTKFNSYDAVGRVTKITTPVGTTNELTYSPRGWLLSSTLRSADGAASQRTAYTYTPSGQIKTATAPDGRVMSYSYDDAQRLTGVTDTLGNTITYVLDNAGNRTAEKTTDPSGTLTRQIARTYDALNRLQKQTGVIQ